MITKDQMQFILDLLTPEQMKKLQAYIRDQQKPEPQENSIEAIRDTETEVKKDPLDFSIRYDRTAQEEGRAGTPVKSQGNTWVDKGTEEKDDFDKLVQRRKTVRDREPAKNKTVQCSTCNRTKEVPQSLPTGNYYRCENCVGG